MPSLTINDAFPDLVGTTQFGDFELYKYLGDSWGCVFMHPGDFTPVCTTELGTAAGKAHEFETRGVKLCGFSCNDAESHRGWIVDIKAVTGYDVEFPLFCDPKRVFATKIGILDATQKDAKGLPLTVRACFILDPKKVIKALITYPASTGRNFDEILRCIDSLKLASNHSVATPADWKPGMDVIVNYPLTDAQAEEKFGKDGFTVVPVPSEADGTAPWLASGGKHYLRTLPDPTTPKADCVLM
ncbi:hypothetical protein CTAYLR_003273 [Chrysophaeum taylorii]|uniref:Thioredoxin domain-containing protein n=1 Tax=Chrysophaeum taylorii TaxID=2483200 RepID=A0AAD7XK95_9STRA|nr:hypothetical protein CTAYLR_003273 [Chrysophaeum taylorii]